MFVDLRGGGARRFLPVWVGENDGKRGDRLVLGDETAKEQPAGSAFRASPGGSVKKLFTWASADDSNTAISIESFRVDLFESDPGHLPQPKFSMSVFRSRSASMPWRCWHPGR